MLQLLVGMALGAMAFTEKGHEIGNQLGNMAIDTAKRVTANVRKDQSPERFAGTAGDNSSDS